MSHAVLASPGELHAATFGQISIGSQLSVDGAVTLTVWVGPSRHNAVSFTYTDLDHGRATYARLRQMGRDGATPDQAAQAITAERADLLNTVRQVVADASASLAADPSPAAGRLGVQLGDAAEVLETDTERAGLDALAADIRRHLAGVSNTRNGSAGTTSYGHIGAAAGDADGMTERPRTWREIRDDHADAAERDRAQRAADAEPALFLTGVGWYGVERVVTR